MVPNKLILRWNSHVKSRATRNPPHKQKPYWAQPKLSSFYCLRAPHLSTHIHVTLVKNKLALGQCALFGSWLSRQQTNMHIFPSQNENSADYVNESTKKLEPVRATGWNFSRRQITPGCPTEIEAARNATSRIESHATQEIQTRGLSRERKRCDDLKNKMYCIKRLKKVSGENKLPRSRLPPAPVLRTRLSHYLNLNVLWAISFFYFVLLLNAHHHTRYLQKQSWSLTHKLWSFRSLKQLKSKQVDDFLFYLGHFNWRFLFKTFGVYLFQYRETIFCCLLININLIWMWIRIRDLSGKVRKFKNKRLLGNKIKTMLNLLNLQHSIIY